MLGLDIKGVAILVGRYLLAYNVREVWIGFY